MPSIRDIYPDKWLRPDVIGNKSVTLSIERVTVENLYNSTARKYENKLVIKFVDKELRLICNKTQTLDLAKIYGTEDYTKWPGQRVRLTTTRASNGKSTIVVNRVGGTSPPAPAAASAPEPHDDLWEPTKPVKDMDEDFYPAKAPAATPENVGARPPDARSPQPAAASVARPPANGEAAPCLLCHAPAGKPHASTCPTRNERATPENVVARPGAPSAPAANSPQPAADSFEKRIFAAVSRLYDSSVPLAEETTTFIRKCRNADSDSALKATAKEMAVVIKSIRETLAAEEIEAEMILTALLGYRCTAKHLPGQLVFNYILKPLRAFDEVALMATGELLELCQAIYLEEAETA